MNLKKFIAQSFIEKGNGSYPWRLMTPHGVYGTRDRELLERVRQITGEALPQGVYHIDVFR